MDVEALIQYARACYATRSESLIIEAFAESAASFRFIGVVPVNYTGLMQAVLIIVREYPYLSGWQHDWEDSCSN